VLCGVTSDSHIGCSQAQPLREAALHPPCLHYTAPGTMLVPCQPCTADTVAAGGCRTGIQEANASSAVGCRVQRTKKAAPQRSRQEPLQSYILSTNTKPRQGAVLCSLIHHKPSSTQHELERRGNHRQHIHNTRNHGVGHSSLQATTKHRVLLLHNKPPTRHPMSKCTTAVPYFTCKIRICTAAKAACHNTQTDATCQAGDACYSPDKHSRPATNHAPRCPLCHAALAAARTVTEGNLGKHQNISIQACWRLFIRVRRSQRILQPVQPAGTQAPQACLMHRVRTACAIKPHSPVHNIILPPASHPKSHNSEDALQKTV
jgi:hypothetical protein